ncbi:MAG: hypothetical protein JXQ87_05600 [Bacteroidia bacterium]
MKKLLLIQFGFLITCLGYSQKLKPDFVELTQMGETFDHSSLTVYDVFDITGFPELEKMSLAESNFQLQMAFSRHSFFNLSLGYELLEAKQRKNKAFLKVGLGFGGLRDIRNTFSLENTTEIHKLYYGDTVVVDSIWHYYAYSGFRYRRNFCFNFSIEQNLLSYKSLSLSIGLFLNAATYHGGEKLQGEQEIIRYSQYFEGGFQIPFGQEIRIPSLDLNMYSVSGQFLISFEFNPKSKYKAIDGLSFIIREGRGIGSFFGPEIPNFDTRSRSANLAVRYRF